MSRHPLRRQHAVVNRRLVVAAGEILVHRPVAARDEVARARDVPGCSHIAGGDQQAILVDPGRTGVIDGGDDVLPLVVLQHAAGGQHCSGRRVAVNLQREVGVRARPRQNNVVTGLPVAQVEESRIGVGLGRINPNLQRQAGGEIREAIGQINVVVHAVEQDRSVVRSGNSRRLAQQHAVHIRAVQAVSRRIHRRRAAGFTKAIVGERRILQHAARIELTEW